MIEPIDFYDDKDGSILKNKVQNLPAFMKTAELLTPTEINKLPDDVFALVAFDGTNKIRKFACVDSGNVALSVIYFMENKNKLPTEAQKVAAANLLKACNWYEFSPPEELKKIAASPCQSASNKKDKKTEMTKVTELYGSYQMPVSRPADKKQQEKTASLNPYVDITGSSVPVQTIKETGQYFCLNGKYPIDTIGQVEKAAAYFERHESHFTPAEKHQYCVKLASRASDLGLKIPYIVQRYGSTKTAQAASLGIYQRQRLFREGTSEHGLLADLKEKYASIKPEVLAVMLENFDKEHGMDKMWGKEIPDPYYTTFDVEKRAMWSFVDRNDYINEDQLRRCAVQDKKVLKEYFGEELVQELEKNPIQIFDSLPLDHKRIIMRIGQAVEE